MGRFSNRFKDYVLLLEPPVLVDFRNFLSFYYGFFIAAAFAAFLKSNNRYFQKYDAKSEFVYRKTLNSSFPTQFFHVVDLSKIKCVS